MNQTIDLTEYRTVREASQELGVSTQYIYKLINAGRLPVVRTRLGFLVDGQAIESLRQEREARDAA